MCLNCQILLYLDLSCCANKCDPLKAETVQISFAEQTISKTCTLALNSLKTFKLRFYNFLKNEEITTVQQMQALKTICRGRWPASFYIA